MDGRYVWLIWTPPHFEKLWEKVGEDGGKHEVWKLIYPSIIPWDVYNVTIIIECNHYY